MADAISVRHMIAAPLQCFYVAQLAFYPLLTAINNGFTPRLRRFPGMWCFRHPWWNFRLVTTRGASRRPYLAVAEVPANPSLIE